MQMDISRFIIGVYIYDSMYVVGFILMIILNSLKYNIYNITRLRSVVYTVLSGAYGMLGLLVFGKLYNAIAAIKGLTPNINVDMLGGVLFLLFCIPITVCAEKFFRKLIARKKNGEHKEIKAVSLRDTLDSITPGLIILSVCGKIGCHFAGCCYGIECSWGIQLPYGSRLFPVQLCEAATLFLILIASYYIKQTKFFRRGMATPLVAAMYLFARFCWEFLRYYVSEMRHFFLGLSLWQIFCVVIFIVVAVWIIVLYKTQPSEPKPKNYFFEKNGKKSEVK